jgi:nucleoside-diphosphate kinase
LRHISFKLFLKLTSGDDLKFYSEGVLVDGYVNLEGGEDVQFRTVKEKKSDLKATDIEIVSKKTDSKNQVTFAFLKPDAIEKKLEVKIINRLVAQGFQIMGLQSKKITIPECQWLYAHVLNCDFYPEMERFITSMPAVMMILQKDNAVEYLRKSIGSTRDAAWGTIRGDYESDGYKNLIHASDSVDRAEKEIRYFFYGASDESID